MRCPICARKTQVVWSDTRAEAKSQVFRRRRHCVKCEMRWNTSEQVTGEPWHFKPKAKAETKEENK